jgi:hypothetical protein
MSSDNRDEVTFSTRQGILALLDGFIQQMQNIRRILLGMSISAIVLGPLAIALSIYLLLGAVIITSGIWLVTGIRQYYSMNQWKKRYEEYLREKEAMDRKIASQFGLDQD